MALRAICLLGSFLLATAAAAQQAPDPALLQRALAAVQVQRNQALDAAAANQVRGEGLADELAKAQARIKELEQKQEAPKASAP